jgi:hypothetical protein
VEQGILKIVISVVTVVALAEIAKRVDPLLSGILMGLPLGAGLAVYFIAFEQGTEFLMKGLPWAIAGLASSLLFCTVYMFAGTRIRRHRLMSVGIASIVAISVFFGSGAILRGIDFTVAGSVFFFLLAAGVNIFILRFMMESKEVKRSKPMGLKSLAMRGFIAGLIILGATIAAPLAGSRWAGILSSFPSTLYALLIIVHYETGDDLYPSIIRGFAHSVPALALFYLGCMAIIPPLGLNAGFVVVYGISASYVYLTHWLLQRIKRRA